MPLDRLPRWAWGAICLPIVALLPGDATIGRGEPPSAPTAAAIEFEDVTATSAIAFVHDDGSGGHRFIPETVTAGLATFDHDLDGRIDIYFPNGSDLPGTDPPRRPRAMLARNRGGWRHRRSRARP
jgi:hypothetical protein